MTHSKCTWVAVLTIASIGVLVAEAQAQRRTLFGQGRGGSPTDLLRREDVREELGISEDQQKQLEELGQSQGAAFRELLPRLREAGSDEARQQIMREYRDGINAKVKAIVDENQYNRLQQLNYQRLGPRALTGDELAAELKLSDEQKDNRQVRRAAKQCPVQSGPE